MTVPTKRLLTSIIAISVVTWWLDSCSAAPDHDRTVTNEHGTYEVPIGRGKSSGWIFGRKLGNAEPAVIENDQWDAKNTERKEDESETGGNKEFPGSDQNLQGSSFNPESSTEGATQATSGASRVLRKSFAESFETQTESVDHDLTKYIQSILDDIEILTEHAQLLLNKLKMEVDNGPQSGCFDCSSILSVAVGDYENTVSKLSNFIERGRDIESVMPKGNEWILGAADLKESDLPSDRDFLTTTMRLKTKLLNLMTLVRECKSHSGDFTRLEDIENIEKSIFSIDNIDLDRLATLRSRTAWSNGGAINRSAAPRLYRTPSGLAKTNFYQKDNSATRQHSSGSPLLASRRSSESSSDDNGDQESAATFKEEIVAFRALLRYLRLVPNQLSDVMNFITSSCYVSNEYKNNEEPGPFTVAPPHLEEMVTTPSKPEAAHIETKIMIAYPPNLEDEKSESDPPPRNHDGPGIFEESDDPAQPFMYEEMVGAPRTEPFTATPYGYGSPPGGFHHASNSFSSSCPCTSGWTGNTVGHHFPADYPHCYYINTIRYEGPVNSYGIGAPSDFYGHQHQPPPFHFHPPIMKHDDSGYTNVDHSHINGAVSSHTNEHRPIVHHHSYHHLKLRLPQALGPLSHYPVKSGDFLALNLDKCSLVGKLDLTSKHIELQLVERPIVHFKTAGRNANRIWQVPLVNFEDLISADSLKKIWLDCERRFAHSRRHRYVRATTKCSGPCDS